MEVLGIGAASNKLLKALFAILAAQNGAMMMISSATSYFMDKGTQEINYNKFDASVYMFSFISYHNFNAVYMSIIFAAFSQLKATREFLGDSQKKLRISDEKTTIENLNVVAVFVDQICEELEAISFCYLINTVLLLLQVSSIVVLGSYGYVSYFIRSNPKEMDLIYGFSTCMWALCLMPFLVWQFLVSHWIKKEGDMIEVILINYTANENFKWNQKVFKKTQLMNLQLQHRRPIISCGGFVIDWSLMFGLITAGFSYFVIIIQFELNTF